MALLAIRLLQVAFSFLVRNFSSEEAGGHYVIMDHNIRRQLWTSNHSDQQVGVCVVERAIQQALVWKYNIIIICGSIMYLWIYKAPTAEVDKWSWKDANSLLAE